MKSAEIASRRYGALSLAIGVAVLPLSWGGSPSPSTASLASAPVTSAPATTAASKFGAHVDPHRIVTASSGDRPYEKAHRLGTQTTTTGQLVTANDRFFGVSSPWNTPTPTSTQWFDHPRLHTLPTGAPLRWWVNTGSVGIWHGQPTDPVWTFKMPAHIAPSFNRNRPAETFEVRAPANLSLGDPDDDRILTVVNGDIYYEVWNTKIDPATRTVTNDPNANGGAPGWATGSIATGPGAGTLGNNDGVRASNFSWLAGLITDREIKQARIDHALVVALPATMLDAGSGTYLAPATAWDNGIARGPFKMGSRIGIPRGTPRPEGLSSLGNAVFDALTTYGAFVGDYIGGQWPAFYTDAQTVTADQVAPLYEFWNHGGSADMDKIIPLLRVADYQP